MRSTWALGLAAFFSCTGASHAVLIIRGGSARYTAVVDAL
jgi:hypothetical protein